MSFSFRSITFLDKNEQLSRALDWFSSAGISVFDTRIQKYQADLQNIIQLLEVNDKDTLSGPEFFANAVNSIYEANQIISVHNGLREFVASPELKRKLNLFVKGPHFAQAEDIEHGTNLPRDIAFELTMAAYFNKAGFEIDFHSTADLRAVLDSRVFFLECKRPRKPTSVRASIKAAESQLFERYKTIDSSSVFGIIALSIDMIVNPKYQLLVADDEHAIDSRMATESQLFAKQYDVNWKRIRDTRTIGMLISIQTPAVSEKQNMITTCNFLAATNIVHSESTPGKLFRSVAEQLTPAIKNV